MNSTRIRTRKSSHAGALMTAFCLCLAGCSGGTIGTGIRGGSAWSSGEAAKINTHVAYFAVEGQIVDHRAKPLPNAAVTVSTPRTSETATTDAQGRFAVQAVQGAGETLVISVQSGSRKGVYRYSSLHQGRGALMLELMLNPDGTLEKIE